MSDYMTLWGAVIRQAIDDSERTKDLLKKERLTVPERCELDELMASYNPEMFLDSLHPYIDRKYLSRLIRKMGNSRRYDCYGEKVKGSKPKNERLCEVYS